MPVARRPVHLPEAVVAMTREETAYAQALNVFGSDQESPEEHDLLRNLRIHSHDGEAVPAVRSVNWQATLAAVSARGPRCDVCNGWTFRPWYVTLLSRTTPRLCGTCETSIPWTEPVAVIGRQATNPFGAPYDRITQ
jgi:hypothetical protein